MFKKMLKKNVFKKNLALSLQIKKKKKSVKISKMSLDLLTPLSLVFFVNTITAHSIKRSHVVQKGAAAFGRGRV